MPGLPPAQIELELNLNERLLASTLGIKTLFFRPPYGIDHQPETADEVELLPIPLSMGYMLVGAQIDPHDWGEVGGVPPPPAQKIVDSVMEQVRAGKGNIVLMHDGGGDRSHTIAALPDGHRSIARRGIHVGAHIRSARRNARASHAAIEFPRTAWSRAPMA